MLAAVWTGVVAISFVLLLLRALYWVYEKVDDFVYELRRWWHRWRKKE